MNLGRPGRARLRVSLTVVAVLAVVCAFLVRLIDIQVVQAEELNVQSFDKRAVPITLYGTRGDIVDANGNVLAMSVDRFDITASPRVALSSEDFNGPVLDGLAAVAAIVGGDPVAMLTKFQTEPDSDFTYLAQGVTLEQYRAVMELGIGWVYAELRPSRTYPNGAVAGNLIGFIGTDGPLEGLEASEDECLASTNGAAVYERGENGIALPGSIVTTTQPEDGGILHTTIDRDLQWYVQQRIGQTYQELGASWVTAVVMRVSDGALMAVADYPSVDPNHVDGSEADDRGSRAFSTPYEPGSILKPLAAAEIIDQGLGTPTTQVMAPGRLDLPDGTYIKDAWAHEPVPYTLTGVLVDSSNTGTTLLSEGLSNQTKYDYLRAFGLGEPTEVGFSGESGGILNDPAGWDLLSASAVQFGQALSLTAVQVASAYQALGNDGVRMPVHLVSGCELPDGTVTQQPSGDGRRVVDAATAQQVVHMLEMVGAHSGSTPDLEIPGYRIGAKSGTAEVAENGGYGDDATLSWAGLAPAEDPQYVVVVSAVVPSSVYSSAHMATTYHDVLAQTLRTFRVPPSTEPAVQIPLTW